MYEYTYFSHFYLIINVIFYPSFLLVTCSSADIFGHHDFVHFLVMVSSLLKLTFAGAVVGFLGYCVYFDRKRRSDPDYRDKVLKRKVHY